MYIPGITQLAWTFHQQYDIKLKMQGVIFCENSHKFVQRFHYFQ